MIAPNTLVGNRYRVVRPLGGGAMKQVYLAHDLRLNNRPCALAEMTDSFANPDAQRQAVVAFTREADILAGLSHEHIVRVYDRFSEANRHYLVMEYVAGDTLEERIKTAGGKLDEAATVDSALQILDAFEYLHTQMPPVIYRDLKPSNVILAPDGRVKLIDFGVARLFQPQIRGTLIGTPGYAAPEQYRGQAEPRSDLYALGALMHFMLTGRDPSTFEPFSFPPLGQMLPNLNPLVVALVDEALAPKIGDRVGSAAECRRRLQAIKSPGMHPASSVTLATSPHAERPCSRCSRRIPTDASLCPYCGVGLGQRDSGGFATEPTVQLLAQDGVPEEASPPRRRGRRWPIAALGAVAIAGASFASFYYYQQYEQEQQRIAAAREHPLKLEQLLLALSTRTGAATAPPTTSFKDTEIASAKYLKWSATFDNELVGRSVGSEKVEARFFDPSGNQIASSDSHRMVGENDKTADFSGVALMPDTVERTLGQYKVALYRGDQLLGQQEFTVNEDLAAKATAEAAAKAAASRRLRQAQEEERKTLRKLALQKQQEEEKQRAGQEAAQGAFDECIVSLATGAYDPAIAQCGEAIRLKPDWAAAYYNRGYAYSHENEDDRAIADFDQAIRLKPDFALAYNGRAFMHLAKHEYDLAIADCDQAIRLKPDLAMAYGIREQAQKAEAAGN